MALATASFDNEGSTNLKGLSINSFEGFGVLIEKANTARPKKTRPAAYLDLSNNNLTAVDVDLIKAITFSCNLDLTKNPLSPTAVALLDGMGNGLRKYQGKGMTEIGQTTVIIDLPAKE